MANFGERIAYWYLRLNGFLLVEDFVLHRAQGRHTSDADLLGVRLLHTHEAINQERLDPDPALAPLLGSFERHCAVIVQVKTGPRFDAAGAFTLDRLRYALAFLGCVSEHDCDRVSAELEGSATVEAEGWIIAKLLIANEANQPDAVCVPLDSALDFIQDRLARFGERKAADRLFFPDPLMQYLAWSAGRGLRRT